jgi:orotidine-5'-phosphate decarboxylase
MAEVIVALDHPSRAEALRLVDRVPGLRWVKVGSTLFVAEGPALVQELKSRGLRVFLDLKWHDIPHQVEGSVRAAAAWGVDLVSVHALGGGRMMTAARHAGGDATRVAAVSVLTSHDAGEWSAIVGRPSTTAADVARLARAAADAGLTAMVASPSEAEQVRAVLGPAAWVVTPGIRPAGASADDQRRTATPSEAVGSGATHLVVGRPITGATDPAAVYDAVCRDAG